MLGDNPEHTPAYKIFHYYIRCRVPISFSRSDIQRYMGTPQYENAAMEQQAANEMVDRQHTVAELVEMHHNGSTIVFVNPEDTVIVYKWLRDHLTTMMGGMQRSLNVGKYPVKDLKKMDAFAEHVYRIARNYDVEKIDIRVGSFARSLMEAKSRRLSSPTKPSVSTGPKEVKEHQSITSDINTSSFQRSLPSLQFGNRRGSSGDS